MPDSQDPKQVNNNDLRNAQFAGGLVNADKVIAGQIGGDNYNIYIGQPSEKVQIDWHQVSSFLLNEQQRLTTNPLTLGEGITYRTEQVYVPLGLVERKKQSRRREDVSPEKGSELYRETEITQTFENKQFLEQVLRDRQSPKSQGRRIAIIGEPGTGKTTLLQQIAQWVSKEIEQSIVIWVSLADLRSHELETYLLEVWLQAVARKAGYAEASNQLKDDFVTQFNQGLVWLMLDGVDEMQTQESNPLEEIERQIRMGALLQQSRIVISCRLNLWDNGINALESFDNYRTLDFSYPQQVEEFICKWFSSQSPAEMQTGQQLCVALREQGKERIRDLVKNPLRLTLLCFNWHLGEGNLPQTKAGLYEQFVADFYEWKKERFATTREQRRRLKKALGEMAREAIDKEAMRFRLRQEFVCEYLGEPDDTDSLFTLALQLGWLNKVGMDADYPKKGVYAFFHPTFQEYFAATSIDNWHFFLNHVHKNPSQGTYRIFESQWKQTILLWLGREEESLKPKKQQLIDALIKFKDECWKLDDFYKGFYEYRAYFLAATGITEFRDNSSKADEIVTQIIKWCFGHFYAKKQEWIQFPYPIEEEAKSALQQTNRKKAIAALVQLLQSNDVPVHIRISVEKSLVEIGTGNEMAISALVKLLQSNDVDKDNHTNAAYSLGEIGTGNEMAISSLVKLLLSPNVDELTRRNAAKSLGKIGTNSEMAISSLVKLLLSPALDKFTRRKVAESLGKIGTDNKDAIAALVQLLQSNNLDSSARGQAAECLGKIGTGNKDAIAALVQLLQSSNVDYGIRKQAISSLGKIGTNDEMAISALVQLLQSNNLDYITRMFVASSLSKIIHNNQDRFEIVNVLSAYQRFDSNCYNILWECSQNMPYPDFYQAWHDHNIITLAIRNLKKILLTRLI
jgi:predicted NACHT family NTPase